MDAQRQSIIEKASALFFRYGIRSVSMDDVSRELGISKKTLYQVIGNKDALVHQCVQADQQAEEKLMDELSASAKNAIDEIFRASQFHLNQLCALSPSLLYDLRKYYPKSWQLIEASTKTKHVEVIVANLQRGIEEGYYRPDMRPRVIAKLFVKQQFTLIEADLFAEENISTPELYIEAFRYHLRGICTPAGLERWKAYQVKHQLTTPTTT